MTPEAMIPEAVIPQAMIPETMTPEIETLTTRGISVRARRAGSGMPIVFLHGAAAGRLGCRSSSGYRNASR